MAAALEARCGLTEHLSVQQIIGLVGNRFVGAPDDVKKILHRPLAPEGDWPYGGSPTASLEAHAKWSVEEARWTALNPRRLMEALAEGPGQNVLVDLVWLPEYLGDRGVLDAPESMNWLEAARHFYPCAADRDPKTACGQHSVLLVGYRVQAKDVVFYFKNSWGASWGVGGYGSVSGRFLRYFGLSARTITAARCGD
ncbi:MAG: hypothetical protein IT371_16615 [Deltaproteobacteria bacterium]|nr:hypothetical protein [Deltaproteobacteria bacterium]